MIKDGLHVAIVQAEVLKCEPTNTVKKACLCRGDILFREALFSNCVLSVPERRSLDAF